MFTYLLLPFILQNFKKFLDLMPFSDPKWTICADFFSTNHYYYLHIAIGTLLLALIVQNVQKKFLQRIQSYEDASFLDPKWFICPQFSFLKEIIIFIYLLAPFILQNFQKILWANPELWGCAIFRFLLNKMFWRKPLLLFSSTYWPFSLGKI